MMQTPLLRVHEESEEHSKEDGELPAINEPFGRAQRWIESEEHQDA